MRARGPVRRPPFLCDTSCQVLTATLLFTRNYFLVGVCGHQGGNYQVLRPMRVVRQTTVRTWLYSGRRLPGFGSFCRISLHVEHNLVLLPVVPTRF